MSIDVTNQISESGAAGIHPRHSPRLRLERPRLDVSRINKGRHNVRILCKNGTTLSMREIINRVYAEGRIEVGILCDLLSNFLPRWATTSRRHPRTTISARATSPTKSSVPSSVANQPVVQAMISSSGASCSAATRSPSTPSSSGRAGSISGSARTSLSEAQARCRENGLSWAPKTKSGKKQGCFYCVFYGIDTGACESRERGDCRSMVYLRAG
jgi:hypothetical protein